MKKLFFLSTILFLSLRLSAQQDDLQTLLPKDPLTITGVLPNGLHYYIRKNTKPEKRAELRLAVNAGSTSENDDQQGLAHLTEHMAFNGTTHFKKSELVDYLESIGTKFGPHLNAYTSFDETVYMLQLPTDNSVIVDKGVQILKDWATGLLFDSTEIEKERGVVVEEWRLGQGAGERLRRKYWPLLFKDSRYAVRIPIGQKEIIEKGSQETLKNFYKDWYRPDLMAVIAVGDFDPKLIEQKIQKEFSGIPIRTSERPLETYMIPDNKDMIIAKATDKEARLANVEIIYKRPREIQTRVEDYRHGIAEGLFTSMLNARLDEIARQASAPYVNAGTDYGAFLRNSFAYSSSATCKEEGIERALTVLIQENERVRRYGFEKSELDRQKSELLRGMQIAFAEREKSESKGFAREYVSNFLTNEPMPGIAYEYDLVKKYLAGISLQEINAFAGDWITDGKNCIVLITAPENANLKMPTDELIKTIMASVKKAELTKYEDKTIDKPLISDNLKGSAISYLKDPDEFNVVEFGLANGVKVFAKQTDFKNDEVLFSSYSWGGWSVYDDKDFLSAASCDEIEELSGMGDFDEISLEKKLSGKVVSCSPYVSELQQGFSGSCSPDDLETLMQLIYGYSQNPRKDNVAFTSWADKQRSALQNRNVDPQLVFNDTISYLMSGYNPRYRPRTIDMINALDDEKWFDIYKERFKNSSSGVYFFVGNFNTDTLKLLSQKYLGSLPPKAQKDSWKDIHAESPAGKSERTVKIGEAQKSTVMLRWNMPFEYNRNNRNEVNVLNKLLNIRLREVLREEKSGVYGVSFISSPEHFPEQKLEQVIYFSCNPENCDMLISAALDVIKEIKEKNCDEKNLVKIKETALRERETYLKENSFWLNVLSTNYQNGEDLRDLLSYNDWIKSLKGSDFPAFADKYLRTDNYAKFILKPADSK